MKTTINLLTVKQATEMLQVSRTTVYRLLSEGDIPHTKIKGCIRIREDDINNYIRRNVVTPVTYDDLRGIKRFKYSPGMKLIE